MSSHLPPNAEPIETTEPSAWAGEAEPLNRRILIVDNNEDTWTSLQKLLELARPVGVDTAADGPGPKQIAPEAMKILLRHGWPGNIRELENAIERACVTSREEHIRPEVLAAFEERHLRRALRKTRGHIGRTAEITGLSRRSISDKIALYKIDKSAFKRV
jgi:hypothetical protein